MQKTLLINVLNYYISKNAATFYDKQTTQLQNSFSFIDLFFSFIDISEIIQKKGLLANVVTEITYSHRMSRICGKAKS